MASCTVFTVQRSYNYGSFLQAFALSSAMERGFGIRPEFAEFGARSIRGQGTRRVAGHARHGRLGRIPFELSKMTALGGELARLDEAPLGSGYAPSDLLLFGSDEIWNVARPEFARYQQFWGTGISGGHRAAYAVSANGSLAGKVPLPDGFADSVRSFDLLSARDRSTREALEEMSGRDVRLVCDPTLLLDAGFYRSEQEAPRVDCPYVLVYSYGLRIPPESVEAVRGYARREGLRLVSAGFWLDWCDECLPVSAFGFLGLVDGAEAVVTDTFHGTVFSTIYRKRFVSFSGGAEKVRDYLALGGLSGRDGSFTGPVDVLRAEPDYGEFERRLEGLRQSSYDYLRDCLALCEGSQLG